MSLYDGLLIDKLLKSNYIPESLLSKTINHFNFSKLNKERGESYL